jgi:hypothetical protein
MRRFWLLASIGVVGVGPPVSSTGVRHLSANIVIGSVGTTDHAARAFRLPRLEKGFGTAGLVLATIAHTVVFASRGAMTSLGARILGAVAA